MEVTIGIASFGNDSWRDLALERALPSAQEQNVPIIVHHGEGSLADARNHILERCETEFLIYLDADDQLEPDYVRAMAQGSADLRAPAIRQVQDPRALVKMHSTDMGRAFMPRVFRHKHECEATCLRYGNWLVIGTCARTALMREAGGWEEWEWSEDWAMWARCWKAGATVEPMYDAIYRAFTRSNSRNHKPSTRFVVNVHHQIEEAVWPDEDRADQLAHPARDEA